MTNLPCFTVYIRLGAEQREVRVRALNAASAIELVRTEHADKMERRWGAIFC